MSDLIARLETMKSYRRPEWPGDERECTNAVCTYESCVTARLCREAAAALRQKEEQIASLTEQRDAAFKHRDRVAELECELAELRAQQPKVREVPFPPSCWCWGANMGEHDAECALRATAAPPAQQPKAE